MIIVIIMIMIMIMIIIIIITVKRRTAFDYNNCDIKIAAAEGAIDIV